MLQRASPTPQFHRPEVREFDQQLREAARRKVLPLPHVAHHLLAIVVAAGGLDDDEAGEVGRLEAAVKGGQRGAPACPPRQVDDDGRVALEAKFPVSFARKTERPLLEKGKPSLYLVQHRVQRHEHVVSSHHDIFFVSKRHVPVQLHHHDLGRPGMYTELQEEGMLSASGLLQAFECHVSQALKDHLLSCAIQEIRHLLAQQ